MTDRNINKEEITEWYGKPYYSLSAYFKNTFGRKCYKISVDAGMSCPNRDGTSGFGGCIFCSEGGSGDFADKFCESDIDGQIMAGLEKCRKNAGDRFVIYFQAFTNTYGDIQYLRKIFTSALRCEQAIGISIATRPDCLEAQKLELLSELAEAFPDKIIWVELGLQTIHEKTAEYIRRHYPLSTYASAVRSLGEIGIPCITHIILGLPNETPEMMYETVRYVNETKPFGVKLQLLHVLRNTDLACDYERGLFRTLELNEYLDIVINCLGFLDRSVVIHRLTGDGAKRDLIAPLWSGNKKMVLNTLHKRLKEQGRFQGDRT